MSAYATLEERFARMFTLQCVEDVMHWDTATMMPDGAATSRADQLALLRVMQHEMLCDDAIEPLLDEAQGAADHLEPWQAANLREMRRVWVHAAAVPADLVGALSKASSLCETAWRTARKDSDFDGVAGKLAEVVALTRQVAQARADKLGVTPYEALLDQHEPGMRCSDIDPLFDDLAAWLPAITERVLEKQAAEDPVPELEGPFPIDAQRSLGMKLMQRVGFDLRHGRLDVSHHPFCGGTPDDVRITTRYDEDDFTSSLMAVLHETGHAMYQLGLPRDWQSQPVGSPRGMGTHESQSLLVEMQACRSLPFLSFAAPLIREAFGRDGAGWTAESLYRRYTRVERGFIRVDADEVTYPAHVIMRYRIEKALIGGELEVAGLPDAWSQGMQALLSITPPDHRRGCLQDIHWFDGAFGYFPSYTLGAITAAQLYRTASKDKPEIVDGLRSGQFAPLMAWLREHVHRLGSRYTTPELIAHATGGPLDIAHYKAHLEARYLDT